MRWILYNVLFAIAYAAMMPKFLLRMKKRGGYRAHFAERCHDEAFFIYDRTHREALLYADGRSRIVPLDDFQSAPPSAEEVAYRQLWRRFYDAVAIRERENPRLRMSRMPKRYWSQMTELRRDDALPPTQ